MRLSYARDLMPERGERREARAMKILWYSKRDKTHPDKKYLAPFSEEGERQDTTCWLMMGEIGPRIRCDKS